VAAAACSQASQKNPGDDLIVDVPSATNTAPPPPPPADAADASDGFYEDLDGYAPVSTCAMCGCAPDASYCFGGGTNHIQFSGRCNWLDAGLEAGLQIGCEPVPSNCSGPLDCNCLIGDLKATIGCYPVCAVVPGKAATLYCPNP
jgi:hypothetical protein